MFLHIPCKISNYIKYRTFNNGITFFCKRFLNRTNKNLEITQDNFSTQVFSRTCGICNGRESNHCPSLSPILYRWAIRKSLRHYYYFFLNRTNTNLEKTQDNFSTLVFTRSCVICIGREPNFCSCDFESDYLPLHYLQVTKIFRSR